MKIKASLAKAIIVIVIQGLAACSSSPSQTEAIPNPTSTVSAPTQAETSTAIPPLPTDTPIACLDEDAEPRVLPPRQTLLEVHFMSDDDIWAWDEKSGLAQQISNTHDARTFSFSPDGKEIAFTRGRQHGQTELWGVDRDGKNPQLLVSADQLHALAGEPSTTEHPYFDEVVYQEWIEATHVLRFEIQRNYDAIGGCCESGGHWQVDLDTGELSAWSLLPESTETQIVLPSPDGNQMAIIHDSAIDLMNSNGSNLRKNVFTFTTTPVPEGGGTIYPQIEWAQDSQSLLAITFDGDIYSDDTTSTTWHIPLDGSQPQQLHTFQAPNFWMNLSPNQKYLAYQKRSQPVTNNNELHLATFDGAKDIIYAVQRNLQFLQWHPDSYHFAYEAWNIFRPLLGNVCGGSVPLLENTDTPATQIQWVDSARFLFAKGPLDPSRGPRELRLGQIGEMSIFIGPFNGETPYYEFNVEDAPLGQE